MTAINEQTVRAQKRALVEYFRAGSKTNGCFCPGMEVEHFLTGAGGAPITFDGVQALMRAMQKPGDTPIEIDGAYMGYYNEAFGISLEPACQLEISIMPQRDAAALMRIYHAFRQALVPLLAARGLTIWALGSHPTRRAETLPLIPKERYKLMDRYFKTSGRHGIHMMRATASTQVSVDYFSEEDFVAKYRAANLLTPMLALLTDNTPLYEGAPNHGYSRRTVIWDDVDPARCGVLPGLMAPDFGFDAYAEALLRVPLIVARHGGETMDAAGKNAAALYTAPLAREDVEHIISMVFFDARLKNYIEMRVADSMPEQYMAAYLALVCGIFDCRDKVDAVLHRYAGAGVADITAAKRQMCGHGYAATVYGRPMDGEVSWLLTLAESPDNAAALAPFRGLADRKKTIRELWKGNGQG